MVDANTTVKLLLRRDAMISAYPELEVHGGRDAVIRMQYGEALYDAEGRKADRNLIEGRQLRGFFDTFIADGSRRVFAPLWWRTFRFIEIEVQAKAEPLTLHALRLNETGYPFEQLASFESSDAQLNRIWDIGWRTMRVDAHETFMDSSYWEQLQYTGDTRIEMLLTYAVSGDARLGRQAIEAFAQSDVDGGFMQGAYPSRGDNVIATFALAWVGMLADWYQEQPDERLVTRHLPRMRQVLARFERPMNKQGLLGKNAHWNFIDWSDEMGCRDAFRTGAARTAVLRGHVRCFAPGVVARAPLGDAARTMSIRKADKAPRNPDILGCQPRGFADERQKGCSQHRNVFAGLYDIATPDERCPSRARTVKGGIEPAAFGPTYSRCTGGAFEHGAGARYHDCSEWPSCCCSFTPVAGKPRPEPFRRHAWRASHGGLLRIVAGIRRRRPAMRA